MRIGIISPYSLTSAGGVQVQVLGLARALAANGHETRVLAPCDGAPPQTGVTPLGASIPTFANGSVAPIAPDFACTLRTVRALRDEEFDVLHLHEPLCPGPTQTALFLRSAPTVGTWHAAGGSLAYLVPGTRWLASRIDVRAAVSADAAEMARNGVGGDYELVFNGVELDHFDKAVPKRNEAPTIAYIGRHEPRKGLTVLLEAMSRLPEGIRLWVMSRGPQTEELQRRYQRDTRIEWLGRVSEAEKLARIKGADVLCVPSLHGESFGVVLLEAMAARTPVVASDLPGYRNVVSVGDEAVLVAPGDPKALAKALVGVLRRPDRAADLVAAGRQRAEQFSMARLADIYADMYERAIAQRASAKG
ncbi:MAG: glycosyltransferase family 4 protein [Acidimicrobiales bacterium]|nr:glycosyltransferase family 4 protein [Acidimicrobiaceae bacterium]MXX43391.1 glycosyltransferase family 4 protein [Acidimicrobiales bacterium]MYD34823.1 glycosyltransferase family 4 protein [Acidimicrobiales bacterium]MYI10795.1 glycosyltransferase family 4 protein [Acidimicrobiales bacterium]